MVQPSRRSTFSQRECNPDPRSTESRDHCQRPQTYKYFSKNRPHDSPCKSHYMMKAIASFVLFASLLVQVRALPSPDSPVTLLAATIDPDCNPCPIMSVSVLGVAGDATTYELLGIAGGADSVYTNIFFDPSPTETLIEGPAGYTLMHVDNTALVDGTHVLTAEDDCTFAGTSAANCVQHLGTAISTVTGAPLKAIQTFTPFGAASGSGPASTGAGSNGSVRAGDGAGIRCLLIMVGFTTAIVATLI
ncbi:hypothetical protein B0H13DRAFT_374453 [Mycena leptocephala]|nr:hypothetical protein B0H13DRAFT_374453 [Mycena leptocephala]